MNYIYSRENKVTEREIHSTALGICEFHLRVVPTNTELFLRSL